MGLFGFGKKAEKAQIPSTFAGRVDKFWAVAFSVREAN